MNARPAPTATRSRIVDRLESLTVLLYVLEGAELSRDQQVADHHHDRYQRQGRGEGQVVGDVVEDDVADELVVGDQPGCDVVAEGEGEGEDRAGDDGGEGERQDHPAEGGDRFGAE